MLVQSRELGDSARVMIVDVGAALRQVAVTAFERLTPAIVDSVSAAMQVAVSYEPQAIVLALGYESHDECRAVRSLCACTRALVLVTEPACDARIVRLLKAGAAGYLFFADAPARLTWAVEETIAGRVPMSAAVAKVALERARRESRPWMRAVEPKQIGALGLSRRQREVLALLSHGHSYEHIALALGVSVNTVRTHLRTIYERLGASTKVEAVLIARELGLLDDLRTG
jgi:DNA-binding NarL/FixJ family response regulator